MDPDANIRERTRILQAAHGRPMSPLECARYDELASAYRSWRANGGFAASRDTVQAFLAVARSYDAE